MALTQNDLNKLSLVVSEAIDIELEKKFDPILHKLKGIHAKADTFFVNFLARLEQFSDKVILYNCSKN